MSYKVSKFTKHTTTLATTVRRKIHATILSGVIFENGVAPALMKGKKTLQNTRSLLRRVTFTLLTLSTCLLYCQVFS